MGIYNHTTLGLKVPKEAVSSDDPNVKDIGWEEHLFVGFYQSDNFFFDQDVVDNYQEIKIRYQDCIDKYGDCEMHISSNTFCSVDMSESKSCSSEPVVLSELLEDAVITSNNHKRSQRECDLVNQRNREARSSSWMSGLKLALATFAIGTCIMFW